VICEVRPLRGRDVWQVLALQRRAFPPDPWTTSTAGGLLNRLTRSGRAGYAGALARLIRFLRLNEARSLIRLAGLVTLGRPRGLSYIVARTGTSVAGYAGLLVKADGEADVPMVAVRADRRGERIGTRLVAEVIAMAAASGCRSVLLYVQAGNTAAHRLYRQAGFAEAGVLRGFYQPSSTDAIVMRLFLPGASTARPPAA
jgi:[ribosomal protein S18]-alanine N-acetyltransferase